LFKPITVKGLVMGQLLLVNYIKVYINKETIISI